MGTLTFSAPDTFVFRSRGWGGMIRAVIVTVFYWDGAAPLIQFRKAVVSTDGENEIKASWLIVSLQLPQTLKARFSLESWSPACLGCLVARASAVLLRGGSLSLVSQGVFSVSLLNSHLEVNVFIVLPDTSSQMQPVVLKSSEAGQRGT